MRTKTLITGAAGGMGRACARLFGAANDLILTDVAPEPLRLFTEELRDDGYIIAGAHAGSIGDDALLAKLAGDLKGHTPFKLIHTAGLGPSQADWQTILAVNLIATAKLLEVVEPLLQPGSVGVLIASIAGHGIPPLPEVQAILDDPLAVDFLQRVAPIVESFTAQAGRAGNGGVAYMLSKHGVIRMGERFAGAWGKRGSRLVTISPGVIMTPMGRKELADSPGTAEARDTAPAGRAGTPMDIALAAQFLASDAAAFISGCDLRVDGGTIAAQRNR